MKPARANDSDAPQTALGIGLDEALLALREGVSPDSPLRARLEKLRERLRQDRLQLAVTGQFKRGKSSFINAILGLPLLPAAVLPVTAVPIFISWHPAALVSVEFRDGRVPEQFSEQDPDRIREFLFRFVAEEANPENRLGVGRVELGYPAPLLSGGTVLIDTPGIGSTFRHNTKAAWRALPEYDAVFFATSPDPPITEAELEYLRCLKPKTSHIFVVMNKADNLTAEDRRRVEDFLKRVICNADLAEQHTQIFTVSSRDALEAKRIGDRAAVERSGIAAVEAHLIEYLAKEKTAALEYAVAKKAADTLGEAITEIDLHLSTLRLPLDDLALKARAFEEALKSIEEQRRTIRDLLTGEHRRLKEELDSRLDRLCAEVSGALAAHIDRGLGTAAGPTWTEAAQKGLAAEMAEAFDAAREDLVEAFSSEANAALAAHQRRIGSLVDAVRRNAADIFDVGFSPRTIDTAFRMSIDPYWVTEDIVGSLIPDPSGVIDRVLPAKLRRSRLRERLVRQIDQLVLRNAGNLHWAILQSLDDTFRRAASEFEERLDASIRLTRGVIEEALVKRRDRSFQVEPALTRLDQAKQQLETVRDRLSLPGP